MPKKRAPGYDTKPKSPAHPSLSSGRPKDASRSLTSSACQSGTSVSDRIQQLRISQGTSASPPRIYPNTAHSLPPSLRNILQLPDAPPPRPRPGLRVTGRLRGPAGPAPPRSWLEKSRIGTGHDYVKHLIISGEDRAKVQKLPGSNLPEEGSLVASTLKALAKNWDWHAQYDQYYLATISVTYKEALLHYIALYSENGIDSSGLDVLFLDEPELEDATGVEGLTQLDLATSIGHHLKLAELRDLFSTKKVVISSHGDDDAVPESWDTQEITASPSALPRFHTLTHLSLAHPSSAATWKGLMDLAPYLTTLTHLSLAYWPTPTLAPNSKTAYRETPQGNVNYGTSNLYSAFDDDWTEAASILRRLGKSTYCLKWLDLTGCFPWVQALALDRIDWFGAWQALETVNVSQGWIPKCLQDEANNQAWRVFIFDRIDTSRYPEAKQLVEWVRIERATEQVEKAVGIRIYKTMQDLAQDDTDEVKSRDTNQESFDDWGTKLATSDSLEVGHRSTRVLFEHGWDAWWIKEAVHEITGSGERVMWLGPWTVG